jgi:hypothetical protein
MAFHRPLDGSRCTSARQGLELGEGLLAWVQGGRVGRQIEQIGVAILGRLAHAFDLMGAQIVHDHDLAGLHVGARICWTQARKIAPFIGPSVNVSVAQVALWR